MRMRAALLVLLVVSSVIHGQTNGLLTGEPPLLHEGHGQDQGVQLGPESSLPAPPVLPEGNSLPSETESSTNSAAHHTSGSQVPPPPGLVATDAFEQVSIKQLAAAAEPAAAPSLGECIKLSLAESFFDSSDSCSVDGPSFPALPMGSSAGDEHRGAPSAQNTSAAGEAASPSPPISGLVIDEPEYVEERQNFASSKDGAKIVAANKEAKKTSSLLDNDGDTFVKNECKAEKWVIIELAQVVNVDEIKLSQHELYSSRVRAFQVRGRMSHPRTDGDYGKNLDSAAWKLLGNFTAQKLKGTQTFKVEVGPWAKYLQLRFLTQYGSEPVCAINDIIVHGRSAAQDLEDQLAGDDAPAAQHPAAQLPPMPTRDVSSTSVTTRGDPQEKVSQPASPDANTPPAVLESSVGPQVGETIVDTRGGDAVTLPDTAVMASENAKNVFVDRIAVMPLDASIAAPGGVVDNGNIDASENIGVIVPPLPVVNTDRAPSASTVGSPIGLAVASEQQVASDRPAAVLGAEPSEVARLPSNTAAFSNRSADASELKRQHSPDLRSNEESLSAVPIISGTPGTISNPASSTASKRTPPASPDDLQLLKGSAGNGRAGGSVYDMLVQELKQLKVQQKAFPRQLAELQRNITAAAVAGRRVASDLAAVTARLATTEAALTIFTSRQNRPADAETLQIPESSLSRLEQRLGAAEQREMALLGLAAMLAGLMVNSMMQQRVIMPLFGSAVTVLSLANGVVGLLQYFDTSDWRSKIPSFQRYA